MNKSKGNMYGFVTHTKNVIKGKCEHDCSYCFIKSLYNGKLFEKPCRFDEKELKENLYRDSTKEKRNYIFFGSSTDMFGEWVLDEWIGRVIEYCNSYPENKYLYQSKNVKNLYSAICMFDFYENSTIATTIETNRHNEWSKAPNVIERAYYLRKIGKMDYRTMVTIEPIIDFDLEEMISILELAKPDIITMGGDSKNNKLPEPDKIKVDSLIAYFQDKNDVRLKDNLGRIIKNK